jgi:quinol monooxygenase YgiN
MGFIQIIDSVTSKMDQIEGLAEEMRADTSSASTAERVTITKDRDRPGHFLVIAEFPSYEAAMENSNNPATQAFAAKMAALCDEPPLFYNLDLIRVDTPAIDLRGGAKAATT